MNSGESLTTLSGNNACSDESTWPQLINDHKGASAAKFDSMIRSFFGTVPLFYRINAELIRDLINTVDCSEFQVGILFDERSKINNDDLKFCIFQGREEALNSNKPVLPLGRFPVALFRALLRIIDDSESIYFSKAYREDLQGRIFPSIAFYVNTVEGTYYGDLSTQWP
jgi:hypothetical protein